MLLAPICTLARLVRGRMQSHNSVSPFSSPGSSTGTPDSDPVVVRGLSYTVVCKTVCPNMQNYAKPSRAKGAELRQGAA